VTGEADLAGMRDTAYTDEAGLADALDRETRGPHCGWSARTRSRLSRTVESGKPAVLTVGATPPLWLSA
jgi:hypothetical protein